MRPVSLIGVPTSAGAFAPGQEQAPAALRAAGLGEALRAAGLDVTDRGDRASFRWRPDRDAPRAQNAPAVIDIVRDTAARVAAARADGHLPLVIGGDCTVGIGTVAALGREAGLAYLDSHADLNIPASVHEGALDWMGLAHMLDVEGVVPGLAGAGPRRPLLDPDRVVLVGWGPDQATEFERAQIDALGIEVVPVDAVARDPAAAAAAALAHLGSRCAEIAVHFDVDLIDFTDVPLSENWGRNEGVPYATALRALAGLLCTPKLSALTVTELNPDHIEAGAGTLERFATDLARALTG